MSCTFQHFIFLYAVFLTRGPIHNLNIRMAQDLKISHVETKTNALIVTFLNAASLIRFVPFYIHFNGASGDNHVYSLTPRGTFQKVKFTI